MEAIYEAKRKVGLQMQKAFDEGGDVGLIHYLESATKGKPKTKTLKK